MHHGPREIEIIVLLLHIVLPSLRLGPVYVFLLSSPKTLIVYLTDALEKDLACKLNTLGFKLACYLPLILVLTLQPKGDIKVNDYSRREHYSPPKQPPRMGGRYRCWCGRHRQGLKIAKAVIPNTIS
ncbi:hypothetical protein BD779DRAFT_434505 [Infundibulicybe gibba]|nr:hypothetical protein BD779DRAFT_434505 [Infundibulicybe gibba]